MMTTILLIRHGQNEYVKTGRLAGRLPEIHLNEVGRIQAQMLAEIQEHKAIVIQSDEETNS